MKAFIVCKECKRRMKVNPKASAVRQALKKNWAVVSAESKDLRVEFLSAINVQRSGLNEGRSFESNRQKD
jgi:hypothetical protein